MLRTLLPDAWPVAVLGIAATFAWLAWHTRLLTAGGALVAGGLAASVLALGGAYHVGTGVGFFVLGSLLSRLPGGRVAAAHAVKGSTRDAGQVLANGGVAWACLLLWPGLPVLWGGAFAAAAADTWATEIGTRWGGTPRLITTLRPVPAGTSGAVSGIGTLGAVLGAASVAALGLLGAVADEILAPGWTPFASYGVRPVLAVLAGGVAGAFFDTLVGATLQVRYRTAAGRVTEHPVAPNGTPHAWAGGLRGIDNDAVNALATLAGALVALVLA